MRRPVPGSETVPTALVPTVRCGERPAKAAQAREQLARAPRPFPRVRLNPAVRDLLAFGYEDFTLEAYEPHPGIKAAIAV